MGSKLPQSQRQTDIDEITGNYSMELGRGGYGVVYKGKDKDGEEIAVKVLQERTGGNHDEEFNKEFYSLLELRHPNIILLVGYCYETEKRINNFTKKFDEIIRAALCFEYAPNGNLRNYISDDDDRLDWHTRYNIIKGTCEGLHYLHHHPSGPIYHLDLKPENILLSRNMVPKIADFGMSRLFSDKTTKVTASPMGTWRYQPLEYKKGGTVSKDFDVYSLGVIIIEIVVGSETYNDIDEFSDSQEIFEFADKKWRSKLKKTETYKSLEAYCEQVKTCLEIALKCMENKRSKRPTIIDIISNLNEVESKTPKRNSVVQESRKDSGSSTQQFRSMPSTWTPDKANYKNTRMGIDRPEKLRGSTSLDSSRDNTRNIQDGSAVIRQNKTRQYFSTGGKGSSSEDSSNKLVLYVTGQGKPGTLDDCDDIRSALEVLRLRFIEKDLFDNPGNLRELKRLCGATIPTRPPALSIAGEQVIGAEDLMELHNEGKLAALLKCTPGLPPRRAKGGAKEAADKDVVVLYVTSQGKEGTLDDCSRVRLALKSARIDFVEKDLFNNRDTLRELQRLSDSARPPTLCINGENVVNTQTLLKLCDQRRIATLFK
ncbi:serine/threonine-protein kinase PBS1 isoform X2 [Brachypodium distachyon]|uniref:Protein kinase domain-containing protein n=2 Tax=Brachypodium distachyon TaxID=15368 RepID=I1IKS4_BRADI|nr:serine/threonine-protein kinase PBS1 isoform X2 [Brachypodium distachyon]XP_024319402.1 serine/threonine-protein kinase PBS1 isoform X2 [Brachypodium distachyon]KQJ88040.1 hypothetical protein BRADI_4g15030v3 [Brachypodium distachyon]|eukprot:XP_010237599.1 serine/threonine-protein kinase PBS1 isoform X2 [Brachypodium distachyon]